MPQDPRTIRERPEISQPIARHVIANTVAMNATSSVITSVDKGTLLGGYGGRHSMQMAECRSLHIAL